MVCLGCFVILLAWCVYALNGCGDWLLFVVFVYCFECLDVWILLVDLVALRVVLLGVIERVYYIELETGIYVWVWVLFCALCLFGVGCSYLDTCFLIWVNLYCFCLGFGDFVFAWMVIVYVVFVMDIFDFIVLVVCFGFLLLYLFDWFVCFGCGFCDSCLLDFWVSFVCVVGGLVRILHLGLGLVAWYRIFRELGYLIFCVLGLVVFCWFSIGLIVYWFLFILFIAFCWLGLWFFVVV